MAVRRYWITKGDKVVRHQACGKTAHEAYLRSGLTGGFNSYTYEVFEEVVLPRSNKRHPTSLWGRNQDQGVKPRKGKKRR